LSICFDFKTVWFQSTTIGHLTQSIFCNKVQAVFVGHLKQNESPTYVVDLSEDIKKRLKVCFNIKSYTKYLSEFVQALLHAFQ